jgi:hypothetical protein
MGIDSVSGGATDSGENTLGSAGKTLSMACGVPQSVLDGGARLS